MRLRSLAGPVLWCALCAAGAAWADPAIELDVEAFDFGTIPQNMVIEREIVIRNAGDEELLITEAYTSCPCTVLNLRGEVVPPGGSVVLEVTFFSRDYQGETDKLIEISCNDPERDLVEVPVRAFVQTPLYVHPDTRSLYFGERKRGETPSLTADFRASDGSALELTVERMDESLFAAAVEPGLEGDVSRARLTISLRADAVAGPIREVIRIGTNVADMPVVDLEVSGGLVGDLEASPAVANFRFVRAGQKMSREIRVTSLRPDQTFTLTGAEVDLPGLSAVVTRASGDEACVLLAGGPVSADDPLAAENRGRVKGVLTIHTDLPHEPVILVDVLYILRK